MFLSFNTTFLSLIGGVMPTIFWLWFWLQEDKLHPEPKSRIFKVFLLGMLSVFMVLPIEQFIFQKLNEISYLTLILWASTEELFKYLVCYFSAIRAQDNNEPIDPVIYMITVALGFSALENSLFLSNLINIGAFTQSIITGNSRFIGATLVHIASSASIGVLMGLSFYKKSSTKIIFLLTGFGISIVLHTLFNSLIINSEGNVFLIFAGFWMLIILLIVLIEKIKSIKS
jgi:RsiW-degrading membrane proteinase PrsW (M82 family)